MTPPEVFFETADMVGLTQAIRSPSLGMEHRHFHMCRCADTDKSKFGPTPRLSRLLAVVDLVQHPDRRWQVLHAEVAETHRRQGLATMLYDRIEAILGAKLRPFGWLSDDAYRFWEARGCAYLKGGYGQVDLLPGMWLGVKAVMTLRDIAVARMMDWGEDATLN